MKSDRKFVKIQAACFDTTAVKCLVASEESEFVIAIVKGNIFLSLPYHHHNLKMILKIVFDPYSSAIFFQILWSNFHRTKYKSAIEDKIQKKIFK